MNIEQIARCYIATPAYEAPDSVKIAFRQFIINLAQVELQGIKFQYVDFQPYFRGPNLCLEDMRADFNRGHLTISAQFNQSNLLGPEVNLISRCIHEVHHLKLNVGFDWEGEVMTAVHLMSFTKNCLFRQIIFSEIIGQVAVCLHQGKFPEYQKVVIFEPRILEQLNDLNL